jgi:hypothetical protein
MSEAFPETPEAVAFELLLAVAEAEGRPIRLRQQRQRRDSGGMNQRPPWPTSPRPELAESRYAIFLIGLPSWAATPFMRSPGR